MQERSFKSGTKKKDASGSAEVDNSVLSMLPVSTPESDNNNLMMLNLLGSSQDGKWVGSRVAKWGGL
jgi:hypothetical protein